MECCAPKSLQAWLSAATPFLRAHEVEHGLMLALGSAAPSASSWSAYVHDQGQVLAAALSTRRERLILSRGPENALALLARHALRPEIKILLGPPDSVHAALTVSERPAHLTMRQGIYALTEVLPPRPAPGHFRLARSHDLDILIAWFAAFHDEALPNEPRLTQEKRIAGIEACFRAHQLFVWQYDGQPVAQTGVGGPTRPSGEHGGGPRINAVYTPPEWRGHGFASNLVAQVNRQVLANGHDFVSLYTDLANPTSNAIYRRLGYQFVAESQEWHLGTV